jgi:hypothetical protein
MTEPHHSPDDEIVSAVLDGEATAAERARVVSDPDLVERMAHLARVRDAVASPVEALDEVTARRLISHAIESASPETAHGITAPSRRQSRWTSPLGIGLGSAAAVLLVALIAVPMLLQSSGEDSDAAFMTVSDEMLESGGARLESGPPQGLASADADDASEETAADSLETWDYAELPEYDTVSDLEAAARAVGAMIRSAGTPNTMGDGTVDTMELAERYRLDGCALAVARLEADPAPVATLRGLVVGVEHLAIVEEDADDELSVTVIDVVDCRVVVPSDLP